jgi:hypothetical protein
VISGYIGIFSHQLHHNIGIYDIGIFHGIVNGSIYDGETTGIPRIQQLDLRKKSLKPE